MAPRPSTRPCSSTLALTATTSSRSTVRDVVLTVSPLVGVMSVLGWRDGEGQHGLTRTVTPGAVKSTGRATLAAYLAERTLGKKGLRAAGPNTMSGHQRRKP
jgi:hypothetical protein